MTPTVDEIIATLTALTDEELRDLSTTPEWAYFMHRLYKLRPGDELTLERIEMDAQVCRQYPASTENYQAQVELNRQRMTRHSRV
jgi:hypothetical protein